MDSLTRAKEWINQNAPMLAVVYQNRYVGMMYDKFASLPAKQQKQVVLGVAAGLFFLIFGLLLSFYLSYWTYASKTRDAEVMINMLQQYQKARRGQDSQIEVLERNNQLAAPDALKDHLVKTASLANISLRMVKAEERPDAGPEAGASPDVRAKAANVKMEKINLNQLRGYLQNIEQGTYNLNITSLQVTNDDKLRGYMNVEMTIVAYLFQLGEEGATP